MLCDDGGQHDEIRRFTPTGILLGIFCLPCCGPICCYSLREKKCIKCGVSLPTGMGGTAYMRYDNETLQTDSPVHHDIETVFNVGHVDSKENDKLLNASHGGMEKDGYDNKSDDGRHDKNRNVQKNTHGNSENPDGPVLSVEALRKHDLEYGASSPPIAAPGHSHYRQRRRQSGSDYAYSIGSSRRGSYTASSRTSVSYRSNRSRSRSKRSRSLSSRSHRTGSTGHRSYLSDYEENYLDDV